MNSKRLHQINTRPKKDGKCVIYLMSRDQRVKDNHALTEAQKEAREKKLPLIVVFNLLPHVKSRLKNQYMFMIDGLQQVEKSLRKHNIPFLILSGNMYKNMCKLEKELNPSIIYFDFSPLKDPQTTYQKIAESVECPCTVTDTHNIVPVRIASSEEEWAAYTIRPKIKKHLHDFLKEPDQVVRHPHHFKKNISNNWSSLEEHIKAKERESYKPTVKSGEKYAQEELSNFIEQKLENYSRKRNDPSQDYQSNLSAYLHFGQLSSLRIALEVQKKTKNSKKTLQESIDTFLEELIVRKELSDNYCNYNTNYDNINGARVWAQETLDEHRNDQRHYVYSLEELELGNTHDSAWNAAQNEMVTKGKMHGYMRMYWAKKILEWSKNPEDAIKTAIYLNDKYELDGYDPNGYAGIMWSIAGVHDRPWKEREIFGKVRYMNYNGLKRKFDIESYIKKWKKKS